MALQSNFSAKIKDVVENLTSAQLMNISNALYTDVFGVADFTSAHTFVPGVRQGAVLPIITEDADYGQFSKADARSCAMNDGVLTTEYDNKVWDLVELNARHAICLKNLEEDFLVFWNKHKLVLEDPTQEPEWADFVDYLTDKAVKNLKAAQWRQGYLGDTSHASDLVNGANGFFVQAEAMNGIKVEKTGTPTGEEIYQALEEAYEAIVMEPWFDASTAVIKMTKRMAQTLVNFLNKTNDINMYDVAIINPSNVVAARKFSVDGLYIFGIKVEAHQEIDRSMAAMGDDETYKAIITRKENLLVGSGSIDKVEQLDLFYDRKDKNIYIDVATYFGVALATSQYALVKFEIGQA